MSMCPEVKNRINILNANQFAVKTIGSRLEIGKNTVWNVRSLETQTFCENYDIYYYGNVSKNLLSAIYNVIFCVC